MDVGRIWNGMLNGELSKTADNEVAALPKTAFRRRLVFHKMYGRKRA